jgi:tRNA(Ile)-lysidine synthase
MNGARLLERVEARLAALPVRGLEVVVGLSGGIDSVVLLEALNELRASLGFTLAALHVHHGLSRNADAWARFCAEHCSAREISLSVEHVTVSRRAGGGIEAAARAARYSAYRAQDAGCVALAHNLDDQAETVLMQLLRGAGPHGMAGMPVVRPLGAGLLVRPMLDVPRSRIEAFARARGLRWIDDESNADTTLSRNLLRAEVLPRLEGHYPGYRESLARAARNAGDAAALADIIARQDLDSMVTTDGVEIAGLTALGSTRAANALRYWLREAGISMPPRIRLKEALRQLTDAPADASPEIALGTHRLRRYRGHLRLVASEVVLANWCVPWRGDTSVALPDGRFVHARRGEGDGIAAVRLEGGDVVLRNRQGGERFQVASNRPRRELKKLFQETGVAPWERDRLPLLCLREQVIWVPGIGVDPGFAAAPGEASVRFELARG